MGNIERNSNNSLWYFLDKIQKILHMKQRHEPLLGFDIR